MYHIVTGIGPEDSQVCSKVNAITELPAVSESVSVTIVHVTDEETDLLTIPTVAAAHERLTDHEIDVSLRTADGTPLNAVLSVADDEDADLICIGGRHRSPAGKMQLRSGSKAVVLNTDRPVLIAGSDEE
ncbi:universal stress protein [Halocatena pleomorpha]|uniref:Universal stress protein n=1 Tax=Halocatena pleomorpha TaxID=1785090 RepID=A0A3P3RHA8_9EURY|nr:universal stress protein [Halocatena pleomorpha]RRJ32842.1 universal stress protein [Halocatena pleomorpha]